MHDGITMGVALALLAGGTAGMIFFGGLWWTIRRGFASATPAAWFIGSFILRTGIVLFGFHVAYGGDWRRLLACTLGFLAARSIVIRRNRPPRGSIATDVGGVGS